MSWIKQQTLQQVFPVILIFSGIIGLLASFALSVEHVALLKDPDHQLSCSFNPVLSCGPVMTSQSATMFGFPNPLLGIAAFGAMTLLGLALLGGARMTSWFWKLYGMSVSASLALAAYLMYQSLFVIQAICVYCLAIWLVLILSAWYTFQYMLAEKHLSSFTRTAFGMWVRRHHFDVLVVIYLLLAALVLREFWFYYGPLLGFKAG